MKKNEIDKVFTGKIMEYLNNGYVIHTESMSGSQTDEIAAVDLMKDKGIVVRIVMLRKFNHLHGTDLIIRVGMTEYKGKYDIVWNNHLQVIEEFIYKMVSDNWFVLPEEYDDIEAKQKVRWENREDEVIYLNKRAAKIVLPYVRRLPKCKSVKPNEIKVLKFLGNNKNKYYVVVKGKTYGLK